MVNLPPVPVRVPIVEPSGDASSIFADWLQKAFLRIGGNLGNAGDTVNSLAAAGYQKFASGLVIQWGTTAGLASASTTSTSFSTAFPTACLQVFLTPKDNSAVATAATGQPGVGNYSTTAFDLYNRTSVTLTFNWVALGY